MSHNPATSTQLAEMFPPVSASWRATWPTGIRKTTEARITSLMSVLHREPFGPRYRRTANAGALQY